MADWVLNKFRYFYFSGIICCSAAPCIASTSMPIEELHVGSVSQISTDTLRPSNVPPPASVLGGSYFDIELSFNLSGLTVSQSDAVQHAYARAELFYETVITGYRIAGPIPDPTDSRFPLGAAASAVQISADIHPIDGAGSLFALAGPTQIVTYTDVFGNVFSYATHGVMEFDSFDVVDLLADGHFFDVVLHEMAHVLGFGTLWDSKYHDGHYAIYDKGGAPGQYIGVNALAMYNAEFSNQDTFIPVETGSGSDSTDHLHWAQLSEVWDGGAKDLMTGYLNSPTTFSNTSLYTFRDIGFTTLDAVPPMAPVPLPAPIALLSGAMLLLRFTRRT